MQFGLSHSIGTFDLEIGLALRIGTSHCDMLGRSVPSQPMCLRVKRASGRETETEKERTRQRKKDRRRERQKDRLMKRESKKKREKERRSEGEKARNSVMKARNSVITHIAT